MGRIYFANIAGALVLALSPAGPVIARTSPDIDSVRLHETASAGAVSPFLDPVPNVCFAEYTGDNTTDFSSPDAKALRDAVAAVAPDGAVKIAGTCAGAVLDSGTTQVALVTKTITLIGGYAPTDWTVSYPLTQPATVDAQGAGRVIYFSGVDGAVADLAVQNGNAGAAEGGGIYATGALSLTGISVLSNTAEGRGGGAYGTGRVTVIAGLFQNNVSGADLGGGLLANNTLAMSGTRFVSNTATAGGGAFVFGVTTLVGGRFEANATSLYSGGGLYVNGNLALTDTQFISNTSQGDAGGALSFDTTLNGGVFQGNRSLGGQGGGMYCTTLTLLGTRFISNTSQGGGGGARVDYMAGLTGGIFQNNQAVVNSGGGLSVGGKLALTDTEFTGNSTPAHGGAVTAFDDATLLGGLFQRNTSGSAGGAFFSEHSLVATRTQFVDNTAGWKGGGAYAGATRLNAGVFLNNRAITGDGGGLFANSTVALTGTQFSGNSAARGGGVFHASGDGRLVNALFARNTSNTALGTSLYLASSGRVAILHNTIASPTLANGSAVWVAAGTVYLTNTIIAGHAIGVGRASGIVNEDYTLFFGNTNDRSGGVTVGVNSRVGDPRFVNAAGGDFHISPYSAARDTGVNAGVTVDIDGGSRPAGGFYDIGYDETLTPPCFATPDNGVTTFGSADAAALRDAVATVSPGGTVKVAGTCAGAVLAEGTTQVALVTTTITLSGGYTPTNWTVSDPVAQPTILDALGAGRVLLFSGVDAAVSNLIVQNGSEASTHGGGIYASGALSMINVGVLSSTAPLAGGGAFAMDAVTVTGGLFQNNRAVTYDGGGLYGSSSVTLAGTRFVGNKAQTSGGGVRAQGPLSVTGGVFEGNSAGNQGGGLYAYKSLALTSAKFIANIAVSGGGLYHYGGVFQNSESALLVNALFARNTAQTYGAAVYFDHPSTADVIHTTVASPTIASASAFFVGSGTIRITNTIVASHTTGFNRGIGTVFEDYTLFDAVPTPRGSGVLAGAHSFSGTAGFANPAADNFHLTSSSAALDFGVDAGISTDFEGAIRPYGAGFDIGYDEWVPPRAYLPVVGR